MRIRSQGPFIPGGKAIVVVVGIQGIDDAVGIGITRVRHVVPHLVCIRDTITITVFAIGIGTNCLFIPGGQAIVIVVGIPRINGPILVGITGSRRVVHLFSILDTVSVAVPIVGIGTQRQLHAGEQTIAVIITVQTAGRLFPGENAVVVIVLVVCIDDSITIAVHRLVDVASHLVLVSDTIAITVRTQRIGSHLQLVPRQESIVVIIGIEIVRGAITVGVLCRRPFVSGGNPVPVIVRIPIVGQLVAIEIVLALVTGRNGITVVIRIADIDVSIPVGITGIGRIGADLHTIENAVVVGILAQGIRIDGRIGLHLGGDPVAVIVIVQVVGRPVTVGIPADRKLLGCGETIVVIVTVLVVGDAVSITVLIGLLALQVVLDAVAIGIRILGAHSIAPGQQSVADHLIFVVRVGLGHRMDHNLVNGPALETDHRGSVALFALHPGP